MAINTIGVTLSYKTSTASAYTKLCPIKDFPDLIGEPNLLEITSLDDEQQTFIPGIKQGGIMAFTINWDETVCTTIKGLEGEALSFKLEFSDGTTFTWSGELTLGVPGKSVDEVIEGTVYIAPSTEISVAFS